jgi:Rhodopirellula transposase DDE domain
VDDEAAIRLRFEALDPVLDERSRRRFAAAEACAAGRGGIALVARITGIARSTINRGLAELATLASAEQPAGRVRRPGGGRKKLSATDATLLSDLHRLVEPTTRGDPQAPLLWTSRSLRNLAEALRAMGHRIGHNVVADLLRQLNYSLQGNRKTREGSDGPDRDEQFGYINAQVSAALAAGEPAISVDTKKKELVGDFKNSGRELRPKGDPEPVRVHDFKIPELGRAVPYGVYDIAGNTGWVSVGIDHDTASFAVNAIRRWWQTMGQVRYPEARSLVITADCGGSNGARVRLWKRELQVLANELRMTITVCHLPPGTSKWNRIEHRLFSFITQNWRGKPLVSFQAIVQLIAATTTRTGLNVKSEIDTAIYPPGIKVTDRDMAAIDITPHAFHGEWNYTIAPTPQ